jgi:hypothetical protein
VTSQTQKSKIFSRLKKRSKSKSPSNYKINKSSYFVLDCNRTKLNY